MMTQILRRGFSAPFGLNYLVQMFGTGEVKNGVANADVKTVAGSFVAANQRSLTFELHHTFFHPAPEDLWRNPEAAGDAFDPRRPVSSHEDNAPYRCPFTGISQTRELDSLADWP